MDGTLIRPEDAIASAPLPALLREAAKQSLLAAMRLMSKGHGFSLVRTHLTHCDQIMTRAAKALDAAERQHVDAAGMEAARQAIVARYYSGNVVALTPVKPAELVKLVLDAAGVSYEGQQGQGRPS